MLFDYLFTTATQIAQIPYSQFETYVTEGKIPERRYVQDRTAPRLQAIETLDK